MTARVDLRLESLESRALLSSVPFIATLTPELSAKTVSLFTVQGRYGNNALNGDWELGITSNTNAPPQQQIDRTWTSGMSEPFSFSFTDKLAGSFLIGGRTVQASYPDRLVRGEPNAIKIWARTTTTGSGLTINDLKITPPGSTDPTVFAGTSITVSRSPGNDFREIIIAGIDFQSLSGGEVKLEGSVTMQFGSQAAPRGSSLQFHVIAAHISDDITISATNAIASEDPSLGPDRGEYVISRGEGNVTGELKVAFRVPSTVPAPLSIASLGPDYALSVGGLPISLSPTGEGSVTIPAGKSSVSIRLAVAADSILEWDETARVEILPAPTGWQPYGIIPNRSFADVTILDDEFLGGLLSRNVDPESTGLTTATVGHGAAAIDLATGEATVALPLVLGSFGPQYTSHDNLRPIVALETQLPLASTGPVTATLTFGGIASEAVTFTGVPGNETVRFVLLGSDEIRGKLPTGRYDYDIALRDAQGRVRTIRGATEIVNRAEEAFGETEFGRRWWLTLLDRLVPGDGISPAMRSATPLPTRSTPTSRLAPLGAATGNGMTLVRGDGTTAWYAADVNTKTSILATEGAADSLWRTGTAIGGHDQAYLASNAGMRSQTATRRLTLANLAADQTYQLFATWTADGDRATNAAYTVSGARPVSGVGTTTTILVNQRYVPGELDAHGVQWRSLGFFHVASGSTITIDVATSYPTATGQTAFADGFVVADAVMAVRNWTFTTPAGSFNQLDAGPLDDTNGFYAGPGGNAPASGDFTLLAKTGTRYRFDAQGLLQGTTDRNENRVAFTYADKDADGVADEVETITTQGGLRWTYGYSGNALSSIEDFAGRVTSVAVVGHNLQSITEPDPGANQPGKIVTSFTYGGPAQRLDTVTDPEGRKTTLTFGTGDRVSGGSYTGGITLALAAYLTDGLDGTLHAPATGKIGAAAPPAGARPEPQAVYTDPRTAVWTYQADRFGLSTAEAAPATKSRLQQDVWLWARNTHGLVIEATEPAGAGGFGGPLPALVTKYDYDGRGNRSKATYPQAKLAGGGPITESWTYSQTFSVLTSATDGRGNTTTYVLDARGNTEEIRAPESRTSYFEYTPAPAAISALQGGLVIKATDPRGSLVVTDYFQPSDKQGQATLSGLVKQVTAGILDANTGRIHGLTAKPTDKTVQTFTYDPQRNPESRTQKMDGVGPDRTTSYVYDLLDRLVTVTAPEAIQVQPSGAGSGSPETPITTYTYDRVGRLVETLDPLGRVTTTVYDDAARTETLLLPAAPQVMTLSPGLGTAPTSPTTITLRDTSGNVVSVTDANLNQTSYAYDARNQLETKTLPSISGLGPSVFTYTYDSVGNLASETLPATNIAAGTADRKTTFRYDAVHRLTLETRPTPGGVSTHSAPLTVLTYDDAGNKASVTDPMQRVTQYAYDAANRLITITAPAVDTGGQPTVTTYGYDRSDNRTLVKDAVNGDDDVVSIYDPLNRKIRDTFVTVAQFNPASPSSPISAAAWMSYAYNDAGEVIQTTDRLERVTDREYDALGRLTKVIQPAAVDGGPRPTTVMQYDAVGNLRLVYDPLQSQALSALSRTEYEYDALDRRVVVRSAAPGGTAGTVRPEVTTGYDAVGNVRTVTDPRGNLTRTDYNAQNLPTLVMQPDPGPGPGGTAADHPPVLTAFTYDPAGNRIETVATSVGMNYKTAVEFDNLDRPYQVTDRTNLVTLTSYLADGLTEASTQFAIGQSESRTTMYEYDGLARTRVVKRQRDTSPQGGPVYDVTTTKYDAVGNLVSLTDPAGNVTEFSYDRAYRKTGDATLARLQPTGSPQLVSRSYQYDKQNNLRLVTDRNGRQTQYDYDGLDRRTTERWLGATGNGYVATFAYDLAGNLTSADDQYGTTPYSSVGYDLDGLYRTTKVTTTLPGVAPTKAPARFDSEVGSTYDVAGNRTGSTVAVNGVTELTTSYGFDNLDRTTSIRQSGPTIFARGVNFDYHADGRVKGTTRFSGNTAGGIFGITIANSFLTGTSVSKFHATNGRLESLTHADSAGKAEVEYTFTYDALDRIKTYRENRPQVRDIDNQPIPAFERPYTYDLTDQTTQAGGQETFFTANGTRTGGGYLTDRDNRLALDPSFVYTYDAEGNRVSRTALAASAAGRVQTVDGSPTITGGSWNVSAAGYGGSQQVGTGFLSSSAATATWQTPALPAGAYEVYATWAPLSAGLQTEPFTLTTTDASGAIKTTNSAAIDFREAPAGLDYDGAKWTRIGGVSSTGIFTATVTLSTGSNNFGEIPADAILVRPVSLEQAKTTYQWDHQNRLTSVTNHSATIAADGSVSFTLADTTTYAYDVLGRRAAVTYDKTDPNDTSGEFHRVSIHDGSQVVWTEQGDNRDRMATSTSTQAMLWAPGTDQLLAIQEQRGPGDIRLPVWTLTDQQGTVKDYLAKGTTTGAESGLIVTRRFSAFGTPELAKLWISGPDGNFTDVGGNSGFFYVGQEYDATTGLQYSRARYYDPVSSEFISQDPLGFAGGDTNLYRRAGNSPANATDPSGLSATAIGAGVGFVGGFIYGGLSGSDGWDWDRAWAAGGSAALVGAGIGSLIDTGGASAILAGAAIAAGAQSASRGNLFTPGAKVDWGGYGRGLVQGTIEGAVGGAVGAGVGLGAARMVAASFGRSALGTTATAVVSGFAGGFAGDQSGQLAAMAVGVQDPAEYSVSRSVYAGAFGAGVAAGVGIVGAARQAWAASAPSKAAQQVQLYSYFESARDASRPFTSSSGRVYLSSHAPGPWLTEQGWLASARRFIRTGRGTPYSSTDNFFTTGPINAAEWGLTPIIPRSANFWKTFGGQYNTSIGTSGFELAEKGGSLLINRPIASTAAQISQARKGLLLESTADVLVISNAIYWGNRFFGGNDDRH